MRQLLSEKEPIVFKQQVARQVTLAPSVQTWADQGTRLGVHISPA